MLISSCARARGPRSCFWVGGVRFVVLNTQRHKDPSGDPEGAAAQDRWLDEEMSRMISPPYVSLRSGSSSSGGTAEANTPPPPPPPPPPRTICLSHIPPFIERSDEPDGYFNLPRPTRRRLLAVLRRGGTTHWFCGHYHRNAGGVDHGEGSEGGGGGGSDGSGRGGKGRKGGGGGRVGGPLEVVVSSAVGCVLTPSGVDPLGLRGFLLPPTLGTGRSGLRVVHVARDRLRHCWFTLDEAAAALNGS